MTAPAHRGNILFVDDMPDTLATISQGLRRHGFRVEAFSDPRYALAEFKPNYYDVMLLDIKMPGMSGFELAKKIWAIESGARVCFFSAYEIYEKEVKIIANGLKTVSFVNKPTTSSELAKRLADMLQRRPEAK